MGQGVDKRALMRRLLVFLRPHRGRFAGALLCMVAYGATDGAVNGGMTGTAGSACSRIADTTVLERFGRRATSI